MILHETNKIAELRKKGHEKTAALMDLAVDAAHAVKEHAGRHCGDPDLVHWGTIVALGMDSRFDYSDILESTDDSVTLIVRMRHLIEPAIVEVDLR